MAHIICESQCHEFCGWPSFDQVNSKTYHQGSEASKGLDHSTRSTLNSSKIGVVNASVGRCGREIWNTTGTWAPTMGWGRWNNQAYQVSSDMNGVIV